MKRSPDDYCLICQASKATKKGSHLFPAPLLAQCVGERDKEESYNIDFTAGDIDTFFGRSNSKNNEFGIILDKKQHHYAYDYLFCPSCESNLGKLESEILPILMHNLRHKPNSYDTISWGNGVEIRVLKDVDPNAFLTFCYSLIFRFNILFKLTNNLNVIKGDEYEKLRLIIHEFIYTGKIDQSTKEAKYFYFNIITKEHFQESDPAHVFSAEKQDNPNIFYICQFVVFWYSMDDVERAKNPFDSAYNKYAERPKIVVLPNNAWDSMQKKVLSTLDEYILKIGERFSEINRKPVQENAYEFKKLVATLQLDPKEEITTTHIQKALKIMSEKYKK